MKRSIAVLTLLGGITTSALAQTTDFSGRWTLNPAKSFMAGEHPAASYQFTKIIEQTGSTLKQTDVTVHADVMNIPMPDLRTTTALIADGKEREIEGRGQFPGMAPPKLRVTTVWQGCTLFVTEMDSQAGAAFTTRRRYFLGTGGRQLIELIESHTGFGDTEQRLIFDKQDSY